MFWVENRPKTIILIVHYGNLFLILIHLSNLLLSGKKRPLLEHLCSFSSFLYTVYQTLHVQYIRIIHVEQLNGLFGQQKNVKDRVVVQGVDSKSSILETR